MGFDEAIDAEEWGSTKAGSSRAKRSAGKDEAAQKTRRVLNFRKGDVVITAAEDPKPAKVSPSSKRSAKKADKRR